MELIQKAVIKRNDTYLTLLRSSQAHYFPEHWDFPGGKLEAVESPFAGIEREVLEETGLIVRAVRPVFVFVADLNNAGQNTHHFTLYETDSLSGDFRFSDEHTDFRWVMKEELLNTAHIEPYIPAYFTWLDASRASR